MRALSLALLVACCGIAAPANAQDTAYDRAVAARLADDPELAVELLEAWLAENSQDVDARLQYGYALLALGRLDDAEAAFAAVLAAAPDYADASQGLALVARRRAEPEAARRGFALLDGSVSDLTGGQSDWHELGATLGLPVGQRDTVELRGNWFERFETQDVELGAGYTHRATDDLWLRGGASVTPSADFRPEVGLLAGLDYRLAPSTIGSLEGQWQRFPVQDVWTLRAGLTQYFDAGRFALSASARAVSADGDRLLVGGTLRAEYLPQDRTRLFLGVGTGPETDLGIVRETTTLFGGAELPLTGDVSLVGSLAREWRETGADRTEARLGIKLSL